MGIDVPPQGAHKVLGSDPGHSSAHLCIHVTVFEPPGRCNGYQTLRTGHPLLLMLHGCSTAGCLMEILAGVVEGVCELPRAAVKETLVEKPRPAEGSSEEVSSILSSWACMMVGLRH